MNSLNSTPTIIQRFIKILKWVISISFIISAFIRFNEKLYTASIAFLLIGFIVLPLFDFWKSKLPGFTNKFAKAGLLVVLFSIAVANLPKKSILVKNNIVTERSSSESNDTVHSKQKIIPKNSDTIIQKAEEIKIITEEPIQNLIIPGIVPGEIYVNFEKLGYKIDKLFSTEGSFFICSSTKNGINYEVKIYCEKGVSKINSIRLTATRIYPQYNKVDDFKPFLKYGCSVPYDGADPKEVSSFIDANFFKRNTKIIIGGVKFTMNCPTEFVRMIDIEKV